MARSQLFFAVRNALSKGNRKGSFVFPELPPPAETGNSVAPSCVCVGGGRGGGGGGEWYNRTADGLEWLTTQTKSRRGKRWDQGVRSRGVWKTRGGREQEALGKGGEGFFKALGEGWQCGWPWELRTKAGRGRSSEQGRCCWDGSRWFEQEVTVPVCETDRSKTESL